jgi:hypothetical protein
MNRLDSKSIGHCRQRILWWRALRGSHTKVRLGSDLTLLGTTSENGALGLSGSWGSRPKCGLCLSLSTTVGRATARAPGGEGGVEGRDDRQSGVPELRDCMNESVVEQSREQETSAREWWLVSAFASPISTVDTQGRLRLPDEQRWSWPAGTRTEDKDVLPV